MQRLALYDLDRTVTFAPTFTPFLVHMAASGNRLRLLGVPLWVLAMIGYKAKLYGRKPLKQFGLRLLVGRIVRNARLQPRIDRFVARQLAQKFDNEIYTAMENAFGSPTDIDSNGKVVILYYNMGASETYTLGYFSPNDLTLGNGCNEMEVFYMNIKYGIEQGSTATANPLDADLIRTLAHEFQHLINYGQRVMIKKNTRNGFLDG